MQQSVEGGTMIRTFRSFVLLMALGSIASSYAAGVNIISGANIRPNLSSSGVFLQTNGIYRLAWSNEEGCKKFAKIILPLPKVSIAGGGQYHYRLEIRKLNGRIDGMTLGRHSYGASDGLSCFAGRYFGPIEKIGTYGIPLTAILECDATILDRIVISSTSKRFSAEFSLSLYSGQYVNPATEKLPHFISQYGWLFLTCLIVSLLIKWVIPGREHDNGSLNAWRYDSIDALKGIGCFAVVFMHYNFPGWTGKAVWAVCRFAVPLFFCISGFFLMNGAGRITAKSLIRKAWKLTVLLAVTGAAYIGYLQIVPEFSPRLGPSNLYGLSWGFLLDNSWFPVIWFVGALIYCYLFLLVFCGKVCRQAFGVLALASWLGAFYLHEVNAIWQTTQVQMRIQMLNATIVWPNTFIFRALPFFLIGVFLRLEVDSVRRWFTGLRAPVALAIVGCAFSVVESVLTGRVQFSVGCTLAMIVMFAWAVENPAGGNRVLRFVGREFSLYVYLSHVPVGTLVDKMARLADVSRAAFFEWTRALIVLALSLLVSWMLALIVRGLRKLLTGPRGWLKRSVHA